MDFTLRRWRSEDIADLARAANSAAIARNLRDVFPHPYTVQDAAWYVEFCMENEQNGQLGRAIVVDNVVMGSISVMRGDDVFRRSAELGYWLAEGCWGQGIMTAAVRQICQETFEQTDIARIYAEPFARNLASRQVLEKAGFTLEGVMKNGAYKEGQLLDYCMYARLRA